MALSSARKLWTVSILHKVSAVHASVFSGHAPELPRAVFFCSKAADSGKGNKTESFDVKMLDILACPLSKKPLRYDEINQELVCDELGVAYPIVDGIPNMNPHDGRMLKNSGDT